MERVYEARSRLKTKLAMSASQVQWIDGQMLETRSPKLANFSGTAELAVRWLLRAHSASTPGMGPFVVSDVLDVVCVIIIGLRRVVCTTG